MQRLVATLTALAALAQALSTHNDDQTYYLEPRGGCLGYKDYYQCIAKLVPTCHSIRNYVYQRKVEGDCARECDPVTRR